MLFVDKEKLNIQRSTPDYIVGELDERQERYSYLQPGILVGWFNGVDTFLEYLQEYMKEPQEGKASARTEDGHFHTFKTYEEAMDVYMNRPHEVLKYVEIDDKLKDWEEDGLSVDYEVTGDFLDIGRYMHGVPEVFGSMKNGNPRRYRANIIVNLSWTGDTDRETVNERLKHVVATVDWLEINGIRCSVTAIASTEVAHVEILVKDFDEILDLRQLAVVSHGDFLRRAMFRFDEYSKTWSYGYGNAYHFSDSYPRREEQESLVELNILIDSRTKNREGYQERFDELRKEITKSLEEGLRPLRVLD